MVRYYEFANLKEMAKPTQELTSKTYYHGTSTENAAKSIIRNGIEPGQITISRAKLAPVAGKVYVTPKLNYAIIYAIGGDLAGSDISNWDQVKKEPYGYVFETSGSELNDIEPDEDSIGGWLHDNTKNGAFHPTNVEDIDLKKMVYHNIKHAMTPKQYNDSIDGLYTAWASGGKRALTKLSDHDKLLLIKWGAHVAHHGNIKPNKVYKFEKIKAKLLNRDGSNFFELAEEIKL